MHTSLEEWFDTLELAQTQLQQQFSVAPHLLCVLDADGLILLLSSAWETALGWPVEQVRWTSWLEWIDPRDHPECQTRFHRLGQQTQSATESWSVWMRGANGCDRLMIWTLKRGDDGIFYGSVCPTEDVRVAVGGLSSEVHTERLQAIFEQIELGINLCDAGGRYIQVNPAFCALLEYSEAELLTMGFQDVTHPEDLNVDLQLSHQLNINAIQGYSLEKRYCCKGGEVRWVKIYTSRVNRADGSLQFVATIVEDIRDRKRVESELRLSEERFRLLTEHIHLVFYIYSADLHQVHYVSPAYEQIWQQPRQAFYRDPESWLAAIHPEDRPTAQANLQRQIQGDVVQDYRILWPDGSIRWIADRSFHMTDEQGQVCMVVGIAEDITDRKQVELLFYQQAQRDRLRLEITQNIRQSLDVSTILETTADQLQAHLQLSRVLIYRFQADGRGQVMAEVVSADQSSTQGTSLTQVYDTARWRAEGWPPIDAVNAVSTLEDVALRTRLLEDLHVRAYVVVPIWQGTTLWGVLAVHQCDRDRRWQPWECGLLQQIAAQLAIALQQSELYQQVQALNANLEAQVNQRTAQLQQTLEFAALLKRITDKVRDSLDEGQILQTAVRELVTALGLYSCDTGLYDLQQQTSTIAYESVQRNVYSARGRVVSFHEFPDLYDRLLQGQSLCMCWILSLGSSLRPAQERYTTLAHPLIDDQGVIGDLWLYRPAHACFDEAEIRLVQQVASQCAIAIRQARLFQAAQQQVEELERLNQLKDDFLNTVSHELRSPLSNIKLATEMLELILHRAEGERAIASTLEPYLKILRDECQREIALINDLLTLVRLDAGTEPLILTQVCLQTWIPHLAEGFMERLQRQQQQLEVQIAADVPPLTTDIASLERILGELLSNACKYTPAHQKIQIWATPRLEGDRPGVQIAVTNFGAEVPASEYERVFDKFYRIPSHDPWRHGGTGLGLALVKKLVERLGGAIALSSGHQRTTFTVHLPLESSPGLST